MASFTQKVDDFRATQKFFKDWGYVNGSIAKKKIIDRALVLSHWDMHIHNSINNYSFFDFVSSIYIFHDKNKFTNFKKSIKEQGLLCGIKIIMIKSWKEISLSLKIGNQTLFLILKEIAFVPNFLRNLVL